jgi:hypothetical protein
MDDEQGDSFWGHIMTLREHGEVLNIDVFFTICHGLSNLIIGFHGNRYHDTRVFDVEGLVVVPLTPPLALSRLVCTFLVWQQPRLQHSQCARRGGSGRVIDDFGPQILRDPSPTIHEW